jgi:hypothetical protein
LAPSPLSLGPALAEHPRIVTTPAFRPGLERGTDVSIYPLGYPVLMGAAWRVGGESAAYFVVPFCFAILVWATARIGAAIAGEWAGPVAAALVAVSPVSHVSAVQPMSDIPATALWAMGWALSLRSGLGASTAAGAATAMAIMVRPNLAPLGLVLAWLQYVGPDTSAARTGSWPRLMAFAATAAIGPGLVLWSQSVLYGHPLAAGYPGWESFYRSAHIATNLGIYPRLLMTVHTPLVLAGLLTPVLLHGRGRGATSNQWHVAWSAVAFALLNFGLYLPYLPYDDLLYLRFMLPSLAALFVLLAAAVVLLGRALARASSWLAPLAVLPALYVAATPVALLEYGRTLGDAQRRVVLMGRYLQQALPGNAVVLSFLQGDAVAFYTGRPTLRYDLVDETSLACFELADRAAADRQEQWPTDVLPP